MHNVRFFYVLAILLLQTIPRSLAALPIPKAPEVGTVPEVPSVGTAGNAAGEGTSGTGGGSTSPRLGADNGQDSSSGTSSGYSPHLGEDPNSGPSTGNNINKHDVGEVFKIILDIVTNAIPNSDGGSSTATITPAPVPTSRVTDRNARACLQANSIYSGCSAQTSDFDLYNNQVYQASCLCYWTSNGMVGWQPQTYDNLMSSCYDYVNSQPMQATAASDVRDQSGLCTSVGDVRASQKSLDASVTSIYSTPASTAGTIQSPTSGALSRRVGGISFFAIGMVLSTVMM